MTVTEYRDRFLQLARYAPADVADDRKKKEFLALKLVKLRYNHSVFPFELISPLFYLSEA